VKCNISSQHTSYFGNGNIAVMESGFEWGLNFCGMVLCGSLKRFPVSSHRLFYESQNL
jgi:hypothetical protein